MHPHHTKLVNFLVRQVLDMLSPSNFVPTNPQVIKATLEEGGRNLWRGADAFVDDTYRILRGQPPQAPMILL